MRDAARTLEVSKSVVQKIVSVYNSTGSFMAVPRGGATRTVLTEQLKIEISLLINDNSTVCLDQIMDRLNLNVSSPTLWRWVKNLGFTYKMTRPIYERRNDDRTKELRVDYIRWYNGLLHTYRYRNLIYIDESPFNIHMLRSHGWAMRGRTPNPIVQPRGQNVTCILAVNGLNLVHCEAIMGSVNGLVFKSYIDRVCAILGREEDFTFVVDNVNFHHRQDLITLQNYEIVFLPPYSPFLNPCEEVFSLIKSRVRRDTPIRGSDDLIQRMQSACAKIEPAFFASYIARCESFFERCLLRQDIERD